MVFIIIHSVINHNITRHLREKTVSQFIFVSFRSEARNLGFNKFSTLRFLTEPVLSQILQSLRSFRMTEQRVRNDIFSNYDTVSKAGNQGRKKILDSGSSPE
jgi:hypothetical protein